MNLIEESQLRQAMHNRNRMNPLSKVANLEDSDILNGE